MNELSNDVWTAASMYYMQGETMDAIASHLGTSRSTVSRLLKQARLSGVVRITLSEPTGLRSGLDSTLTRMFGVNTTVVPVKSGTTEIHRLDQVARIAGQMVTDMVEDNSAVGIAWGTTLDAITHYVVPTSDRSCQEWLLHLVARLSISRSQPSSTVRQQRPQCGKNVPFRPSLKHIESSILLFLASEPLTARSPPTSIQRVT